MKADLFTSIATFIVGIIIAFVACNMILPEIGSFNIKNVNIDSSASLAEPDIEVFNYRAINPTVEVYVGTGCEAYDENGECIDDNILESEEIIPEENNNGATD